MPQRTWLITGVSSGFGRELTTQLLEDGEAPRNSGTYQRPHHATSRTAVRRSAT